MTFIYLTAATLNGYLADEQDSLEWLFDVGGDGPDLGPFLSTVTVVVMGASTYQWLFDHEQLLDHPERWRVYFDDRPCVIFTHRELPRPSDAHILFRSGSVADALDEIRQLAADGTVWIQGGGDLAGQFLDADALDEVVVSLAPAILASGKPLLPRTIGPERLDLLSARQTGRFAELRYAVRPPGSALAAD